MVYDPIGDRWIISDFAWSNFSSGAMYECMAVSASGDPVSGGWHFYAWQTSTGGSLPDYPKLGVWPDGIYMSANVFSTTGSGSFQHVQVWAFDRQRMEAGQTADERHLLAAAHDRRGDGLQPAAEQHAHGHGRAAGRRAELLRLDLRRLRDPGLEVPRRLGEPVELEPDGADERADRDLQRRAGHRAGAGGQRRSTRSATG